MRCVKQVFEDGHRACLALVLVLAAVLRIYNLGVPSQWMDEILVPQNASYPVQYILELCRNVEVHPPLYYFIVKFMLFFGKSDFTLRLVSAVCGVGVVYCVYALGKELFDDSLGLYAAAFAAVNTHALLLSRYIRPYSFVLLFFTLALVFLARYAKHRGRGAFLLVLFCDAVVFLAHNIAPFLLGVQVVCLGLVALRERSAQLCRATAGLTLFLGTLTALSWFLLMHGNPHVSRLLGSPMGLWKGLEIVGAASLQNVFVFESPLVWGVLSAAMVVGGTALWKRNLGAALFVFTLSAFSPLALLATGSAWNVYSRHLCQLIAPASILLGAALWGIEAPRGRHAVVALCVALVGAVCILGPGHKRFYEVDSYRNPVIGTNYLLLARQMQNAIDDGDVVVVSNDYFRNGLNWYGDQLGPVNLLRAQTLRPDTARVRIKVLANLHYGALAKDASDFEQRYAPESTRRLEENVRLFTLAPQSREPEFAVVHLPERIAVPMELEGFFRKVAGFDQAAYFMDSRGPFVMAARNNAQATLEYHFVDHTGVTGQTIVLNFAYKNFGRQNHVVAETVFDDEPPVSHPLSLGPDPHGQQQVVLRRTTPYRKLAVKVRLVCAQHTPLFPGGNFETLRFEGLEAAFCQTQNEASCLSDMTAALRRNALRNFWDEKFLSTSRVGQRLQSLPPGLINVQDDVDQAWTRFVPTTHDQPVALRVELDPVREDVFAYPRVGEKGVVALYQLDADGKREELLYLQGEPGRWTPISACYPLALNAHMKVNGKYVVEIVLQGERAQIWNKNEVIFW